jgi:hypothetical protein
MPSQLTRSLRKPGALDPATMQRITDPDEVQQIMLAESGLTNLSSMTRFLSLAQSALYRTETGNLLIGSSEPELHEHERWHFLRLATRKKEWLILRGDAQWHHVTPMSFLSSMQKAHEETIMGLAQYQGSGLTYESARLAMALQGRVGGLKEIAAAVVAARATDLDAVERHELLYHYDSWLARNPEYNGMPRDLVRRMHGLGAMVEVNNILMSPLDGPSLWDGIYTSAVRP